MSSLPHIYIESTLTIIFPFIIVIPFFYYILCSKEKDKIRSKNKLLSALLIAIYSFQPTILSILMEMSMCEKLHFGSFLRIFMIESCDSERYLLFYYCLVIPLLVIFAGFIPLILFIYIMFKKKRNILFDQSITQKIGFIFTGYKKENYYW